MLLFEFSSCYFFLFVIAIFSEIDSFACVGDSCLVVGFILVYGWTVYSHVRCVFENISNILLSAGARPNFHSRYFFLFVLG